MEIEELRHAYRVPAEIMDFALPLLDGSRPEVEPPLAYRKGGDPPRLVQVGEDELMRARFARPWRSRTSTDCSP